MRDIERIDNFCAILAEIWKKNCPDWRFGQFMINVLNSFDRDPWFYEEDQMIEEICAFFDKNKSKEEEKTEEAE